MVTPERLRELRHGAGLTQEQLAKAVGVRIPVLSNWERGKFIPSTSMLEPLANGLGTDINSLFLPAGS